MISKFKLKLKKKYSGCYIAVNLLAQHEDDPAPTELEIGTDLDEPRKFAINGIYTFKTKRECVEIIESIINAGGDCLNEFTLIKKEK